MPSHRHWISIVRLMAATVFTLRGWGDFTAEILKKGMNRWQQHHPQ